MVADVRMVADSGLTACEAQLADVVAFDVHSADAAVSDPVGILQRGLQMDDDLWLRLAVGIIQWFAGREVGLLFRADLDDFAFHAGADRIVLAERAWRAALHHVVEA